MIIKYRYGRGLNIVFPWVCWIGLLAGFIMMIIRLELPHWSYAILVGVRMLFYPWAIYVSRRYFDGIPFCRVISSDT